MVVEHASPSSTRLVDVNEVRRALQLLVGPGQVVEIRALEASLDANGRYTRSYGGYFDNAKDLINAIATIRHAMGIYITLQPCYKDLLHKAKNKLVEQKKDLSTPDKHITGYRWLAIDCDPERVAGISSTEAEHEKALAMCRKVRESLKALGWPDPALADSGNGGHLLYRIDLPVGDTQLVKRTLEGLKQFNEEDVHVDLTMFNPSRIIKLYGTLACKGDNTDERPHRLSRILEAPDELLIVTREQLESIAVPAGEQVAPAPSKKKTSTKQGNVYSNDGTKLKSFIEKHNIKVKSSDPYEGGTRYHLEACAWDPSHVDKSACLYEFPDGRLGASCSHNSCDGKHWKDYRLVFEPNAYDKEETALTRLMRIADLAHLICTPSGALYARVPINGHHEIVSIGEKGSGFRRWLVHRFKNEHGFAPNSDAISQTMAGVQADAEFIGERAEIYTRIAEKDGCIYLDLANDKWQCVEIGHDGWRVITCPPVYFRRPSGMLPLPVPTTGGTLDDLKELINAKDDRDYKLITAWLVGTLHPKGPYPVLNLNGERGSAKTKTTTILRSIVDPSIAPTRNTPKDDREAAITAQNNMVIALDNLSSMPLWLSDLLCRIATGSGFSARELYTDDAERVFNNRRPIIMNGIEDGIISQGDLLNRTMMVTLSPPDTYRSEANIDDLFAQKHPQLLGALLTVASAALRDHRRVELDKPPRMADFALWVVASESTLGWTPGTFMDIYTENQASATSIIMETSPVAIAIVQFMASNKRLTGKDKWEGLVSELHNELLSYDVYKDAKTAPKVASKLTGQLKRIASSLRVQDIDVQYLPRTKHGIKVKIAYIPGVGKPENGVGKQSNGVGKLPSGVGKNDVPTPPIGPDESLVDDKNSDIGVGSVGNLPSSTIFYPPLDLEKKEKEESNNGRAVREEKVPTPPTPTSHDDALSLMREMMQLASSLDEEMQSFIARIREEVFSPDDEIRKKASDELEKMLEHMRQKQLSAGLSVDNVDDASIPDDFNYEPEECTDCACGLTRQLDGNKVCVRCYPPKGYSAYSHLIDEMYPRKHKVEFGKGGAQ